MIEGAGSSTVERDRKAEHIRLALSRRMQFERNYLDDYRFEHSGLPELDLDDVDVGTSFLGRRLGAPILISCMTGGTGEAARINRNLAIGAERHGFAVGVGSQRKALEDPATADSFAVRPYAPNVPVLANLGAVQLNYGCGIEQCRQAVAMIAADALVLHLNPLQEAIQPEGQTRFAGLLDRMAEVARELEVPVVAKEIGCGLSAAVGRRLLSAGIRILDSAGLGGTSWARIEAARAGDDPLGELFANWGIPAPESIQALAALPGVTVIGSGGVRNGVDVAKAIALGADVVGLAFPFLGAAAESAEAVDAVCRRLVRELRICMFCVGARNLAELRRVALTRTADGGSR
jgi:isopentenyl-diphosphate delta-isomerase